MLPLGGTALGENIAHGSENENRTDEKIMEYEEIRELKKSEKSTVCLVREKDGERVCVRKNLKGRHEIYGILQNCSHPFLPELYQVAISDSGTTVIEEYIEGQPLGGGCLTSGQMRVVVRDLCTVLEFLHKKGIIHRDIKPSNILLAADGHIRLIDFDAARMHRSEQEQDTRLLGTRGYAPPEQYGFAQTDERADIYSLGVTLEQILGKKGDRPGYRRIIRKCTRLDPDKRYQSVRQVRRDFFWGGGGPLYGGLALFLLILLVGAASWQSVGRGEAPAESMALQMLPAPENPRWDAETGIALWSNVPESGSTQPEVEYKWKLCRRDTPDDPPDLDEDVWELEDSMLGNGWIEVDGVPTFALNLSMDLWDNGFYYFAVAAVGDGIHYSDSPYVVSDAFEYTGADAPYLPAPRDLEWMMATNDTGWVFYATIGNLEEYDDQDSFNVTVYDKEGEYVINNIWTKEYIMQENEYNGVRIRPEFLKERDGAFRFSVQVQSSRPNEYRSSFLPDPVTEEYLSPWYYY